MCINLCLPTIVILSSFQGLFLCFNGIPTKSGWQVMLYCHPELVSGSLRNIDYWL